MRVLRRVATGPAEPGGTLGGKALAQQGGGRGRRARVRLVRRAIRRPGRGRRPPGRSALPDEDVQPSRGLPVPRVQGGLQDPDKRAAARVQRHQSAALRAVRQDVPVEDAVRVPLAVPRAAQVPAHAPALRPVPGRVRGREPPVRSHPVPARAARQGGVRDLRPDVQVVHGPEHTPPVPQRVAQLLVQGVRQVVPEQVHAPGARDIAHGRQAVPVPHLRPVPEPRVPAAVARQDAPGGRVDRADVLLLRRVRLRGPRARAARGAREKGARGRGPDGRRGRAAHVRGQVRVLRLDVRGRGAPGRAPGHGAREQRRRLGGVRVRGVLVRVQHVLPADHAQADARHQRRVHDGRHRPRVRQQRRGPRPVPHTAVLLVPALRQNVPALHVLLPAQAAQARARRAGAHVRPVPRGLQDVLEAHVPQEDGPRAARDRQAGEQVPVHGVPAQVRQAGRTEPAQDAHAHRRGGRRVQVPVPPVRQVLQLRGVAEDPRPGGRVVRVPVQ